MSIKLYSERNSIERIVYNQNRGCFIFFFGKIIQAGYFLFPAKDGNT